MAQRLVKAVNSVLAPLDMRLIRASNVTKLQEMAAEARPTEAQRPGEPDSRAPMFVPPGHFYSPVPNLDEIRPREEEIFRRDRPEIPGIDMREAEQWALVESFRDRFYASIPFGDEPKGGLRYGYVNGSYAYSDAIFLHCMIRHMAPKRIIEVGSGFSSCVTLDTNDRFFEGRIACEFIEPYPELLLSLLKPEEKARTTLHHKPLQEVSLDLFRGLAPGDILFIDSTHVSRVASDVNYIFFEILPALQPGVVIHFHDIFWPFEYPKSWVYEGRGWTEIYLLRAFLEFNRAFELVVMNTFLETRNPAWFHEHMPLCMKNPGGSIWIRKTA